MKLFSDSLNLIQMCTGWNNDHPKLYATQKLGLIRNKPDAATTLAIINADRAGPKCNDEEAAIHINGSAKKEALDKSLSSFLIYFEYGDMKWVTATMTTWSYNNMRTLLFA